MAKLVRIQYELPNKQMLTAGVVSDTKEKALDHLRYKVPSVQRIVSVSVVTDVHAVDDEITDRFVNNSKKVKDYQKKIKELNKLLQEYEVDLEYYKNELDHRNQQPQVSSKDIKEALKGNSKETEPKKIYCCPYCEFETEKKVGLKSHITKTHKE